MKTMRFYLLCALALAGAACVTACSLVVERGKLVAVRAITIARDWMLGVALDAAASFGRQVVEQRPLVQRIRAAAFRLRLVKRERPVISSQWRLCAST